MANNVTVYTADPKLAALLNTTARLVELEPY